MRRRAARSGSRGELRQGESTVLKNQKGNVKGMKKSGNEINNSVTGTIGVIVPVYRIKEEYLRCCIESIINQTYQDIEVILVDDCSPDGCGKVCDEYAQLDHRIRVIHMQENKGQANARNEGVQVCKAKWITFVDADDWLDLDTFQKVSDRLNDDDDILIYHVCVNYANKEVDVSNVVDNWNSREKLETLQLTALSVPSKVYPNGEFYEAPWAKIYSRRLLHDNKLLFRNYKLKEDGIFFQEVIEKSDNAKEVNVGKYHYRMREGSETNRYREDTPNEQREILDFFWNFFEVNQKSEEYLHALYYLTLVSMKNCIISYFYNENLKLPYNKRFSMCKEFFSASPYKDVFNYIKLRELRTIYKIMALLIKYRLYGLLNVLYRITKSLNKMKCYP